MAVKLHFRVITSKQTDNVEVYFKGKAINDLIVK